MSLGRPTSLEAIRCFIRETELQLEQCNDPVTRGFLEQQIALAYKDFEKNHALSIVSKAASFQKRLSIMEEKNEFEERNEFEEEFIGFERVPLVQNSVDSAFPESLVHLKKEMDSIPFEKVQGTDTDSNTMVDEHVTMVLKQNSEKLDSPSGKPIYKKRRCLALTVVMLMAVIGIGIGIYIEINKSMNFTMNNNQTSESGPRPNNTFVFTTTISGRPTTVTILPNSPGPGLNPTSSNPLNPIQNPSAQPPSNPVQNPSVPVPPVQPPQTVQSRCEQIHETNRLIPYVVWGTTPDNEKVFWDSNGCNQRMCSYWKSKYNVIPYRSWGTLPDDFKPSWDYPLMNCNRA
jgi:hypothetical protein